MRIATWNVNSIKIRLPHLLDYLDQAKPDIVALQELKCVTADMPTAELLARGYHVEAVGQKTYNGVALVSRHPIQVTLRALPGDESDEQARYLEADIEGIRTGCLYLPNGNTVDTEKFPYKLNWMKRLLQRASELRQQSIPFVLAGDYNVCPTDDDVYDPVGWQNDALCKPESRAAFRRLIHLGLTDAYRALNPEPHQYSFWDYQAGAWPKDHGVRIDHLLLSPTLADRLQASGIDRGPRSWERASDHTPVWCDLISSAGDA